MTKNFLSNKELLKNIHLSKLTYCESIDKRFNDYDVIGTIDDLTENNVVRIMTNQHLIERIHEEGFTPNFPPFVHMAYVDGEPTIVLKSHMREGYVIDDLVRQMELLINRYAMKKNWNGYSWIEDMKSEALVKLWQRGLNFNEARSDNPFAYFTQIVTNEFKQFLNTQKRYSDALTKYRRELDVDESDD